MATEARIYYIRPEVIIMSDPYNGNGPIVAMRHPGTPTEIEWAMINRALETSGMKIVGEPQMRWDGIWFAPCKEVE